jgi:membrane protease YdiL (CAAX protease family)
MRLRGVLARHDGLKNLWRAGLFIGILAVLLAAVLFVLGILLSIVAPHAPRLPIPYPPWFIAVNELSLFLPVLGATCAMAWLEDQPVWAYGLQGPARVRLLLMGMLAGLAALSVVVGVILFSGHGVAARGDLNALGDLRYGVEWLAVSMLIGLTEELAFRGYLLRALERGIGFWPAALLTCVLFAGGHVVDQGETPMGLIGLLAAGMLFCVAVKRTGSLWWAIGFHGAWDYAENFIFGTPDSGAFCLGALSHIRPLGAGWLSGGVTGPEGSVFSLAVLAITGAAVWHGTRRI